MQILLFDFLNAYPYQRALELAGLSYQLYPSPRAVWEAWRAGVGDAALLPLAGALNRPEGWTSWGIASRGVVASVLFVSEKPISAWRHVQLDERSLSSVRIIRHLVEKKALPPLHFLIDSNDAVQADAQLLIGDEALRQKGRYSYWLDVGTLAYETFRRGTVYALWWVRSPYQYTLSRIWRWYLPQRMQWVADAARRYGFSPQEIENYWELLWYRLPRLGLRYWSRVFRRASAEIPHEMPSEGL